MAAKLFKAALHFPGENADFEDTEAKKGGTENGQTPVVILFGWSGSAEKHLAKYSEFYNKNGYITVLVSLPGQGLFYHADKTPEIIQELLAVLADNRLTDNPVIAHVFSNGGSMIYSRFTDALYNPSITKPDDLQLRLKGVVLDSAPSKWSIRMAMKAMMDSFRGNFVFRYLLGLGIMFTLGVVQLLSKVMTLGPSNWYDLYDWMAHDKARCPQLFLYSHADALIPSVDVEEMIETRRLKGVPVKQLTWDDSRHVKHFLAHPEVYTKTCLDFVRDCLASRL